MWLPQPPELSLEKEKVSVGLSIAPARAGLQDGAATCSPLLTAHRQAPAWGSPPGLVSFPVQLFLVVIQGFEPRVVSESLDLSGVGRMYCR